MKTLIALLLGSLLIEAALLYYFPYATLVIFLISVTSISVVVYRENQKLLDNSYRFVLKPGYVRPINGAIKYVTATDLMDLYNVHGSECIVYDPYKTLEPYDIILPPLDDNSYLEFKQQAIEDFHRRQHSVVNSPYIYGT